jgi:urease accessory protein
VAPADGAGIAHAHRAQKAGDVGALEKLDEAVAALKLAREVRDASLRCGKALLSALNDVFEPAPLGYLAAAVRAGRLEGHQCTVFGAGAAALGVAERDAVLAFLQSGLINMASVGARLIPLGQVETQRIIARAQPLLHESLAVALARPLDALGGSGVIFDIAAMEHERLETRLCMS